MSTDKNKVPTPVKAVLPIAPRVVPVATGPPLVLNPTAPLATAPPTAAVQPATGKKPFAESTVGQLLAQSGGLPGLASAAATIAATIKGTPATTGGPGDLTGTGAAAGEDYPLPDQGDNTILGLPPFAFAAVVLLLIVGIAVVVHKSGRSGAGG